MTVELAVVQTHNVYQCIPVAISTLELVSLCIVLTKFLMYWNFKIDVRLVILLLGGWAKHFIVKVNPDDF